MFAFARPGNGKAVESKRMWKSLSILGALLVFAPCGAFGARRPEHARRAMVVTVEPHATEIGVEVLKAGGNAIDAACARRDVAVAS